MKQQFIATVGVFLPSCKFIVDGKGYTFLEAFTSPSSETDNVAIALQTERHVEIFRDVRLGPELFVAILVHIRDLLNSRPTENSVMTDEWSDIAVRDSVLDGRVDQVGKESDTVLKIGVDDLHDARRKLHDTHIRRLLHFGGSIEKAVGRNTSIGIDYVTQVSICRKNMITCKAYSR